jgi:pimeloyl-ACP methyl ester carboxylesterase
MATSSRGLAYDVIDMAPPWRARGRPVVFHHGIGANRDTWAGWLPQVAARHPVVRFDMRGFGASAPLPAAPADLMDVLIEDVLDVAPDDGPVHLVGESAGGTIVLAAALRHPGRVASVTISNAAIAGSGIGQIDSWRPLFADGVKAWNDRMMECRFAPGAIDEAAAAWYASVQSRTQPSAALAVADMLAATDLTRELPRLHCPLLVLIPDASPFVPASMYDGIEARVPQVEKKVFEGVRHGLPFSHPQECARTLLDFIQRRAS